MRNGLRKYGSYFLLLILWMMGGESYAQCPGSVYAGEDTIICYSNNIVYLDGKVIRPNGSLSSGMWYNGSGRFIPDSTTLNAQYVPSQAEADQGYVDLILIPAQNCNPSKSDTVHITIRTLPQETVTGPMGICEYSGGNSYSVPSASNITYDWHVVGGYVTSGSSTNSISVTWGNRGPGYIYLIRTDTLGCYDVSSLDPISRFHFNTEDFAVAAIGSDATSWDSDAHSDGTAFTIDANCGGSKGIDLEIPGSTFDRGKLSMTFSWQRHESEAVFFERGNTKFYIDGGYLKIQLEQYDTSGNAQTVGPINSGYSPPSDDVFRYFTFCYDSASGVARMLVNDSIVWDYETGTQSSLYWTGAGNLFVGKRMDGNCSGKPLLDWLNISIPVSIYSKPTTSLSGTDPVCYLKTEAYYCDTPSYVSYNWTATGGSVLSGQNSAYSTIQWTSAGNDSANLFLTDTRTGCDSSFSFAVNVNSLPTTSISGNDSLCAGDTLNISESSNATGYSWTSSYSGGASTSQSFSFVADSSGSYSAYVQLSDSTTGCVNNDTFDFWVQSYPVPVISAPAASCFGEPVVVNVNLSGGVSYAWQASGGSIQSGQGTNEIIIDYSSAGPYTINLSVEDVLFGCSADDSSAIVVRQKPVTSSIYHY
ncbi:MAG: hypothetical protein GC180_05595 [Bacteroidetes bacterium]|nr:hypothetical protein [Bacteroidota bacterium]